MHNRIQVVRFDPRTNDLVAENIYLGNRSIFPGVEPANFRCFVRVVADFGDIPAFFVDNFFVVGVVWKVFAFEADVIVAFTSQLSNSGRTDMSYSRSGRWCSCMRPDMA